MGWTLNDVAHVDFRLEEPDDPVADIETDYSKLNAINQCPTWGIVRYELAKAFEESGRAMALEAGSACHEAFAAIRVLDLCKQGFSREDIEAVAIDKFKEERYKESAMVNWLIAYIDAYADGADDDMRNAGMNFALEALDSSGFYDDPRDNRRTLANLEEAIISYYDMWPSHRGRESTIFVGDDGLVGIEIPFAIRISFTFHNSTTLTIRYIGKIDGLHRRAKEPFELVVHENKTTSRLGDAWSAGMRLTHQTTGYSVAASLLTGEQCNVVYSLGLAIPQPRTGIGVVRDIANRHERHVRDWLAWILDQAFYIATFRDNPVHAPRYTMSCNRFFRPCSFIPLCDQEPEEFIETLDDMIEDRWSPLDD